MEKGNELKSHGNSAPEEVKKPEQTLRLELLPAPALRGHTTPRTHSVSSAEELAGRFPRLRKSFCDAGPTPQRK